jgi:hypothetical protein
MGICNNVGIPLGWILAPSERADTYLLFAQHMEEQHRISVKDKHFLSDGGAGLRKYADRTGHPQQRCYRHLLQDMGPSSYVAMLAHRLLFTSSKNHYQSIYHQTFIDFQNGWSEGIINQNGADIFCRLFGIAREGTGFSEVDRMAFAAQALWGEVRMEAGMLGASNHIEGFHSHVSEDAKHAPSTEVRVGMISDRVETSASNFHHRCFAAAKAHVDKLRKHAEACQAQAKHTGSPDLWSGHTCSVCTSCLLYSKRFGVEGLPCVHTVLQWHFPALVAPPFRAAKCNGNTVIFAEPARPALEEPWDFSSKDDNPAPGPPGSASLDLTDADGHFLERLTRELNGIVHHGRKVTLLFLASAWGAFAQAHGHEHTTEDPTVRSLFTVTMYKQLKSKS